MTVSATDGEPAAFASSNVFPLSAGKPATSIDILPALKREDSHGTAPLGWNIVVYDVTCS